MESYKKMTALLSSELDRYLLKHSAVAKKLPKNALVVFQVAGEADFNRWGEKLTLKYREPNQTVIYVKVKGFQTSSVLKDPKTEIGISGK